MCSQTYKPGCRRVLLNVEQVEQGTSPLSRRAKEEKVPVSENHYMQLYIMIILITQSLQMALQDVVL